jgi:plastocyanin
LRRRRTVRALAAAGALALGAGGPLADAAPPANSVSIQFAAFGPTPIDALPGEAVSWTNQSERVHTVTADDGSFDSGELPGGATFSHTLAAVGAVTYHCRIHPEMRGEIDVWPVILDPLPLVPTPTGNRVVFSGRTTQPADPVEIQRATQGQEFVTVATTHPAPDGAWSISVTAQTTADYRAASAEGTSGIRRLLVSDRRVDIRRTRAGVRITVTPSDPYARVVLELNLPERFGWWPTRWGRLDYVSHTEFRVRRRVPIRVVLVDRDGWTPLATSRVLRPPRRSTKSNRNLR